VNGHNLVNADHHHAVAVLKSVGNDITMVITKATGLATNQQVRNYSIGGISAARENVELTVNC